MTIFFQAPIYYSRICVWTVNDDSLDCGIYMAYFMEQYEGTMNIDPLYEVCL